MRNFFSKLVILVVLNPLSRLPFGVIYFVSDGLFLLIYYLVGYRKKVVFNNLRNSFPEKSEGEIKKIAKGFYRHFCDLIVEAIKVAGLSREEMIKRMHIENTELVEDLYKKNKNIIVMAGHYNNWEWAATAVPAFINHRCKGIFNPLKNKEFNDYISVSRSKFGMELVSKRKFYNELIPVSGEKPKAVFFLSDQLPKNPYKTFWTDFLNQETGFPYGAGVYAIKYDYPVVFGEVHKEKRGYYKIRMKVITEYPLKTSQDEILEKYSQLLEQQIINNPQFWLWSHKRWKRSKPADYESRFDK